MAIAYLVSGQTIQLENSEFKLDKQIDKEWQLINLANGKAKLIPVDDLLAGYAGGEIRFPVSRHPSVPEHIKLDDGSRVAAHLDLYPKAVAEELKRKRHFLEAYLKEFGDLRAQTWIQMGLDRHWNSTWGEQPHPSSVARWLKLYVDAGRDIRALTQKNLNKGNTKSRYPLEVVEICQKAIAKIYLQPTRGSIKATLTDAIKHVCHENVMRPEGFKLPLPTQSFIKGLIGKISEYERYASRFGKAAAEHKFRNAVHTNLTERPLQRVEIDHTRLDIIVVDDETGVEIGRPWLTLVVDVETRAILGFSFSFDPPSHMTVAKALKMALMPKINLSKRWPSIKGYWPMFGVMEVLVVDNGLEFHGESLAAACLALGITIAYCPRRRGWWKPYVERVLGTLNRAVTDGMPGRTFAKTDQKGDYDPVKEAAIPFKVMEEMIAKWIVDVYHETIHSTLGCKPRVAWEEAMDLQNIPMAPDVSELDAIMGVVATRVLSHRGIEINLLRYNSDELKSLRQRYGNLKEALIKWNPEDLGYIHVLPPDGSCIRVPVVDEYKSYADGLTLFRHKACKAYAKKYLQGRNDVESLNDAYAAIQELATEGMRSTKKKTLNRPGF
jgi:putative transposase